MKGYKEYTMVVHKDGRDATWPNTFDLRSTIGKEEDSNIANAIYLLRYGISFKEFMFIVLCVMTNRYEIFFRSDTWVFLKLNIINSKFSLIISKLWEWMMYRPPYWAPTYELQQTIEVSSLSSPWRGL